MANRREIVAAGAGGLLGLASLLSKAGWTEAFAQTAPPRVDAPAFDQGQIAAQARELAKAPFKPLGATLPESFSNLSYDQYVGIVSRAGNALWNIDGSPFQIEPLHRGFIFANPMAIALVDNGVAKALSYDPAMFDFGKITPPANPGDIGYSGFRVLRQRGSNSFAESAIFQGANFFRARAIGQNLGVMARSLAIRTADPKGEEFPFLRAVWIEKPTPAATTLVIHALLDSPSLAGAYRFTLRPGEATIIDIEATLFARVALDHLGLGGMQATHLVGPMERRKSEDARPGVYEVSGLQMSNGAGEWLWRPVSNRETLQISSFIDENPKGFGLLMRERNFAQFQDDDQHWELRPSLWIEPIGDWGPGTVQLVEIPAESESNDNIVAYWRPRQPLAAGGEMTFAYRQFWCWDPPERPPLAVTTHSRAGRIGTTKRRHFIVEFTGDVLGDVQRAPDIRPVLTAQPGTILGMRTLLSREGKTCRVIFDVDPGTEIFCEMRLALTSEGKPISETWLYRWTP